MSSDYKHDGGWGSDDPVERAAQKKAWDAVRARLCLKVAMIASATGQRFGQLIYNTVAGPNDGPCPAVFYCTDEALLEMLNAYGEQLDNAQEPI